MGESRTKNEDRERVSTRECSSLHPCIIIRHHQETGEKEETHQKIQERQGFRKVCVTCGEIGKRGIRLDYLIHRLQTSFRIVSITELGGGYLHSLSGLLEDVEGVPPPIGSL